MGKRGKRKYTCEDCKAESWHHWVELNCARMSCPACGSSHLAPCTEAAKDAADTARAARVFGMPSTTRPQRPIAPSTSQNLQRRHAPQLNSDRSSAKSTDVIGATQRESDFMSIAEAARQISSLYGRQIDVWHISRLLKDEDGIPDAKDSIGERIVPTSALPQIIEDLRTQGWLPKQ